MHAHCPQLSELSATVESIWFEETLASQLVHHGIYTEASDLEVGTMLSPTQQQQEAMAAASDSQQGAGSFVDPFAATMKTRKMASNSALLAGLLYAGAFLCFVISAITWARRRRAVNRAAGSSEMHSMGRVSEHGVDDEEVDRHWRGSSHEHARQKQVLMYSGSGHHDHDNSRQFNAGGHNGHNDDDLSFNYSER